ncbi:MAG: ATP-binding cassette domain-containing protein, partial [Kofleriaceae bacterium]
MSEVAIHFANVSKAYGARSVLRGVSLEIAKGSRVGLIGPAASGKSVLCKLACGLEAPDAGEIRVLGESVVGKREVDLGPLRRRMGMLFQNYALFDYLTVQANVAFPLEQRGGFTRDAIDARVA